MSTSARLKVKVDFHCRICSVLFRFPRSRCSQWWSSRVQLHRSLSLGNSSSDGSKLHRHLPSDLPTTTCNNNKPQNPILFLLIITIPSPPRICSARYTLTLLSLSRHVSLILFLVDRHANKPNNRQTPRRNRRKATPRHRDDRKIERDRQGS